MEIVRRLFRGRLDGNEEERRNSFELTPSRFKRGDLSLFLSLSDRPCTRDMVVGRVSSALIVSWPVIAIVALQRGLLFFEQVRPPFFRLVSSPIVPGNVP